MPGPPAPDRDRTATGEPSNAIPLMTSAPTASSAAPGAPVTNGTLEHEVHQFYVAPAPLPKAPVRPPPTQEMQGNLLLYTLHTKLYLDHKRMEKYIGEFENLFERLEKLGDDFAVPERLKVSFLLFSFKGHYFGKRIAKLRERKEQDLSWDAVKSSLIKEYWRLKEIEEEVREKGVQSKRNRFSLRKSKPEANNCVAQPKKKS